MSVVARSTSTVTRAASTTIRRRSVTLEPRSINSRYAPRALIHVSTEGEDGIGQRLCRRSCSARQGNRQRDGPPCVPMKPRHLWVRHRKRELTSRGEEAHLGRAGAQRAPRGVAADPPPQPAISTDRRWPSGSPSRIAPRWNISPAPRASGSPTNSHVGSALPGADVSDVGRPRGVGLRHCHLLLEQIRDPRGRLSNDRPAPVDAPS